MSSPALPIIPCNFSLLQSVLYRAKDGSLSAYTTHDRLKSGNLNISACQIKSLYSAHGNTYADISILPHRNRTRTVKLPSPDISIPVIPASTKFLV